MSFRTLGVATLQRSSLGLVLLTVAAFSACGPSTPPSDGSGGAASGGGASGGAGSGGAASGGAMPGGGVDAAGGTSSGGTTAQDCSEPSDAGPLITRLPCLLSAAG